jgi:prepilin-type N-terminal cleavage/methylation domain-containing protein
MVMKRPTNYSSGFTIIELIVAIVILLLVGTLTIMQKNDVEASQRDQTRKTAVNAFYYGLKQGYFKQHNAYPPSIDDKKLPYIDKSLFTDPRGKKIGIPKSDYHYRGLNCEADACKKFEVSAKLEKEDIYKKSSDD